MDDIQQQVNEEEIATFYNKVEEIWPSNEPWYKYTKAQIEKLIGVFITIEQPKLIRNIRV